VLIEALRFDKSTCGRAVSDSALTISLRRASAQRLAAGMKAFAHKNGLETTSFVHRGRTRAIESEHMTRTTYDRAASDPTQTQIHILTNRPAQVSPSQVVGLTASAFVFSRWPLVATASRRMLLRGQGSSCNRILHHWTSLHGCGHATWPHGQHRLRALIPLRCIEHARRPTAGLI
jgi:hypothetical protein